ncbi:DUF6691 family protein [Parvularcula oceani]|uniref:DUF6691 family protein n=1 Tax=Parvularcula oceani TaxID=1247963 RepID=UPI0004E187E7|nr:DUF6691 family protein [Parvularcula oceani]
MRQLLTAFLIGSFFGGGLIVSGMTNPAKVVAFLDLFGAWDPSLALVMGGALGVTLVGYRLVLRRGSPTLAAQFHMPDKTEITRDLVLGSTLFGIGWGLAGLCPGPAVAVLPMAPVQGLVFFAGLYGGVLAYQFTRQRKASPSAA